MAVTVDAAASATANNNVSTRSWSHTITANSDTTLPLLLVGVMWNGSVTVSSVTYNSVAMTEVTHKYSGGATPGSTPNANVAIYQLTTPATGAHSVAVTWSGSTRVVAHSISFHDASGSAPLGTPVTASGSNGSPTLSVTGASTNNFFYTAVTCGSVDNTNATPQTLTAANGQTDQGNAVTNIVTTYNIRGAQGSLTGVAGAQTLGWTAGSTGANEFWAEIGVEVLAGTGATASTGSGFPPRSLMLLGVGA